MKRKLKPQPENPSRKPRNPLLDTPAAEALRKHFLAQDHQIHIYASDLVSPSVVPVMLEIAENGGAETKAKIIADLYSLTKSFNTDISEAFPLLCEGLKSESPDTKKLAAESIRFIAAQGYDVSSIIPDIAGMLRYDPKAPFLTITLLKLLEQCADQGHDISVAFPKLASLIMIQTCDIDEHVMKVFEAAASNPDTYTELIQTLLPFMTFNSSTIREFVEGVLCAPDNPQRPEQTVSYVMRHVTSPEFMVQAEQNTISFTETVRVLGNLLKRLERMMEGSA